MWQGLCSRYLVRPAWHERTKSKSCGGFFLSFFPFSHLFSPLFFYFPLFFFFLSLTRRHNSVNSLCVSVGTFRDCLSSTWEPNLENKSSVSCGYVLKDVGRHLVGIQKARGRSIPSETVGIWHLSWKSILKKTLKYLSENWVWCC